MILKKIAERDFHGISAYQKLRMIFHKSMILNKNHNFVVDLLKKKSL